MSANSVDSLIAAVEPARLPSHPGYLAHWGAHLEPGVRAQIARIDALPGLAAGFNFPFPVNYVLMLTPHGTPTDEVVRAIRRRSTPLNEADQAMRSYCERLVVEWDLGDSIGIATPLKAWAEVHATGANLDAVAHMERVTCALAAAIPDFPGWATQLREDAPALHAAFLTLPADFAGVRRINVFRPYAQIERILGGLVGALAAQPSRRAELERIELAKYSAAYAKTGVLPPFPTLIVYLRRDAAWETWGSFLEPLLMRGPAVEIDEEYALRVAPGVTYTEGFRLYKRYLAALDLLDGVYDCGTGYATVLRSG